MIFLTTMKEELEKKNCQNCKKCSRGKYCSILGEANEKYRAVADLTGVQDAKTYVERCLTKMDIEEGYCCDQFESQWVEYPFVVDKIEISDIKYNTWISHQVGTLVKIKPCGEETTYLGIYLGEVPKKIGATLNKDDSVLKVFAKTGPAIFIPQLSRIVFGYESWWSEIKSAKELTDIIENDNTGYAKYLKGLLNG